VVAVNGSAANVGHAVGGTFGTLELNANGSYTYTDTNAASVIGLGGIAEDTFNFSVGDGQSSASAQLTAVIVSPGDNYVTGPAGSSINGDWGPTVLNGLAGNMTLWAGGGGPQYLLGANGDTLVGGSTKDTFMFTPNFGDVGIYNFHKNDVIDLPESLVSSLAALRDDMSTSNGNTVISIDGDAITFPSLTAAHLHAHNFHFVV
jgi:VCBS repeat-containing protein